MDKICIFRIGCKFDSYYRILNSCKGKYELVRSVSKADWCIFPICSCTEYNIQLCREELEEVIITKKENCKIIVTGCITTVQDYKKDFLKPLKIDYIVGVENQVEEICKILGVEPSISVYSYYNFPGSITICDGCMNKCSFCRIHYSNRPLKSIPIEIIEDQVKDLVKNNIAFITLQGLNVSQYGIDLYGKKSLHILLKRLSKIPKLKGIEIQSLSLSDLYDDLLQELYNNYLVIRVYIDIQSGSDRLLKVMNVGHTVSDIRKCFSLLKSKLSYTRIISGFPTESEQDVVQTIKLLKHLNIEDIQISQYQNSVGIPSSNLPQLSEEISELHYKMYLDAVQEIRDKIFSKEDGETFLAYVSNISLTSILAYIPQNGRTIQVLTSNAPSAYNIGDKIIVEFKNNNYYLLEMLEMASETPDIVSEVDIANNIVDLLSTMDSRTNEFTYTKLQLGEILNNIFYYYYDNSIEKFKSNIQDTPEILRIHLLNMYSTMS